MARELAQAGGAVVQSETRRRERVTTGCYDRVRCGPQRTGKHHLGHDGYVGVSTGRLPPWQVSSNAARIAAVLRLLYGTAMGLGPVLRLVTWLWHIADTVEARVGQALTPWDWAGHLALAYS